MISFPEFLCIGGWEEFTPTIVIDYPYGASTYHDYSGYNFYEVLSIRTFIFYVKNNTLQ